MAEETHHEMVDRKRRERMQRIDALDPAIRAIVHDYGFAVVNAHLPPPPLDDPPDIPPEFDRRQGRAA